MASIQRTQQQSSPSGCRQADRHIPSSNQNKKLSAMLFVALVLLSTSLSSVEGMQDEITKHESDAINDFAMEILSCFDLPGVSLGVVRGRATYETQDGVADWDTGHPMSSKTLLHLGSTAKALVPYVLAEIMNGKGNQDGR
ncbi:protein flp-like [Elysia marginata]|uniref:Protein flp-like n=1 Tax=Elysia marginata TaxID=1093978 RepID=A0AAV4JAH4_9GAST|nr:protein flp-like [Elysia marginata]